ncbi:PepSY domain-containing protein [Paenibacillus sp. NPDC058071]|uniref:PepSY domain-containing protein n=1 Tax=Paenibacillus sp. NPDC058071 TaxID=3346326 RepID=UPI0036DE755E
MSKTRWSWVLLAFLALAIVIAVSFAVYRKTSDTDGSTVEEARQTILSQYQGELSELPATGAAYRFQLENDQGRYELEVGRNSNNIVSIRLLERYRAPVQTTKPPVNSSVPSEEATPRPSVSPDVIESIRLTESEAAAVALAKIKGNVSDIDLDKENGKWYYFVEIKTEDGREATIQLHASSGRIESVTWDNDKEDESD